MRYIKKFEDLTINDVSLVGGKNASLGEMIRALSKKGVLIPTGFAITADAYWHYIDHNKFHEKIKTIMGQLTDINDIDSLQKVGKEVRALLVSGTFPDDLRDEIIKAYSNLSNHYKQKNCDVAVRSSATAEDLPTASFAGQQETFLNVSGERELLEACKKCIASLFTDRAIVYRVQKGFDHFDVALSIGVQKMVRSDLASSGVGFSLDTETGFADAIIINSSFGLGESIVKGLVIPDEFVVYKPTLQEGFAPIIKKQLGDKKVKIIYGQHELVQEVATNKHEQNSFSLSDNEILELARYILIIEQHYSDLKDTWVPMDVEWAKDGNDGKLYIIQARPETIHGIKKNHHILKQYHLKERAGSPLLIGQSIGQQIVAGVARVIEDVNHIGQVKEGDILVTEMTDPDWVPIMKRAAGIITNRGGRTCHAAIVSRELGIPAIVGAHQATQKIKTGQQITMDCSRGSDGFIYDGARAFDITEVELTTLPALPVKVMVNLADPGSAFRVSQLPVDGVGLARMEFIINNTIKIHPMALLEPEKITDASVIQEIEKITAAYNDKPTFFVDNLAYGIGMIAAAFYPRNVIVRLSDFKSNEYRNLIGGRFFEPEEENPMIGFRGASRYYHKNYKDAFALECKALKKVRDEMGLINVTIMVPFVRTIGEGQRVLDEMKKHDLAQGKNDLDIIMMCEIPSNVILIDDFCKLFDGISIGSNDLTQLTLGVDRDSALLTNLFDERDPAVKKMMQLAVEGAKRNKVYSGICGQAPSDYPEIAQFLIDIGIDSLSLNPDTVISFLLRY